MYFKWKDEYATGIETIDAQHKQLLEIGARIFILAELDDGYDHYDEIMEVLGELKDYTQYHFGYEEQLMETNGYERYENQKFQHFFVIKKIEKFQSSDIDDRQKETIIGLAEFISDWIINHILKEDMQYREFFISRGIK
ncbi:MAG: hemerythrin family protein [Clostridiaceae bacterium]|jgi:hemerythrin|nr:hemerythrin family protein [Clostridiaceae bacterium]